MKREQAEGIFDLALSMAGPMVASTETPVDDTFLRFANFFRRDPSFDSVMDRLFGPEVAPLTAGDGETVSLATPEQDAEAISEPAVAAFVQKENLSAEEVEKYAAIFIGILSAIRKARQARKAEQAGG